MNVAEFTQDTLGFDNAEIGSYILLLIDYWANARAIPNDDKYLRTVARCSEATWMRTKGLLAAKFDVHNGTWTQGRLERAIAESRARKAAIARASAAGVQARRDSGQLPPVQPSVHPSGQPLTQAQVVLFSREHDRVLERLAHLSNLYEGGRKWAPKDAEERTKLRARREELRQMLGVVA